MNPANFDIELPSNLKERMPRDSPYPLAAALLIFLTVINAVLLYQHHLTHLDAELVNTKPIQPEYTSDYIPSSISKVSRLSRNLQVNRSTEGHHHHDHNHLHSSKCQPFTEDDPRPRILITGPKYAVYIGSKTIILPPKFSSTGGAGVVGGHLVSKLKSSPYSYSSIKVVDSLHGSGGSTYNLFDPGNSSICLKTSKYYEMLCSLASYFLDTKSYSIDLEKDLCVGDLTVSHSHGGDLSSMFRNVDLVIHLVRDHFFFANKHCQQKA